MPKVTVIVPIYNVEAYVRTCLDSLLQQTYNDYVIYAVNDGSPAGEQVILDEYSQKYPDRIIAIQKENGGYGSVLQLAIEKCESEYFLVCDPDDYLEKDALEHLVRLAEEKNADLVIGSKYFIYGDGDDKDYDASYNQQFTTLKNEHVYEAKSKEFEDLFFVDPSPHSKLYKKSLASRIQFPTKVGYTDNLLFMMSLMNAERVVYSEKPCAYYLVNRAGNTMTDVKPQVIDAHTKVFNAIMDQSKNCRYVPGMFYYRMFESMKFTFYQLRRIQSEQAVKIEKGEVLYSFVEKLIPYRKVILSYYSHYSLTKSIEKLKDKLILTPTVSKPIYRNWVKKIVR